MHVLHHTRKKRKVKPLWMRYFISPVVHIFHPIPPFPRLSALWFFSLFFFWKSWLFCSRSENSKWACVLCIVPSSSIWWEKLEKTMSGGGVRPLCCLFHLFSLLFLASLVDSNALWRPTAGGHLLNWGTLILVHTHTLECVWARAQVIQHMAACMQNKLWITKAENIKWKLNTNSNTLT